MEFIVILIIGLLYYKNMGYIININSSLLALSTVIRTLAEK